MKLTKTWLTNSLYYLPQPYLKIAMESAIEVSWKDLTDFSSFWTVGPDILLVLSVTDFHEFANLYGVFPGKEHLMHFRIIDLLLSMSLKYRNNPQNFIMKLDFQPLNILEKFWFKFWVAMQIRIIFWIKKKCSRTKLRFSKNKWITLDHTLSREKVNYHLKELYFLMIAFTFWRVTSV